MEAKMGLPFLPSLGESIKLKLCCVIHHFEKSTAIASCKEIKRRRCYDKLPTQQTCNPDEAN